MLVIERIRGCTGDGIMRADRLFLSLTAATTLCWVAGCGFYPTPKPVRTGVAKASADSAAIDQGAINHSVQRATFETSITRDPVAPAVLQVMRPVAPDVRPFEQWSEQEAAADALGRIGAQAIPYLQQALRSPDSHVKKQAAEVLARMGSDAKGAVNDLLPLLDDADPEVRKVAVRTLGRIGPDAAAAIPALMRSLVQEEPLAPAPLLPSAPPLGPGSSEQVAPAFFQSTPSNSTPLAPPEPRPLPQP